MMGKDFLPSLSLDRVLYEHTHTRLCLFTSDGRGGGGVREPRIRFLFLWSNLFLCPQRFCPSAVRPDTRDQKKRLLEISILSLLIFNASGQPGFLQPIGKA